MQSHTHLHRIPLVSQAVDALALQQQQAMLVVVDLLQHSRLVGWLVGLVGGCVLSFLLRLLFRGLCTGMYEHAVKAGALRASGS